MVGLVFSHCISEWNGYFGKGFAVFGPEVVGVVIGKAMKPSDIGFGARLLEVEDSLKFGGVGGDSVGGHDVPQVRGGSGEEPAFLEL